MKKIILSILVFCALSIPALGQTFFQKPFGPEGTAVRGFARDRFGTIYCAGHGIFKSTDEGVTWTKISMPESPYLTRDYDCIAVDTSGTLFVGYGGLCLRSTDAGKTWSYGMGGGGDETHFILVAPDQRVYMGSSIGLYQSTDHGVTFRALNIPTNHMFDLDINADGVWFAASGAGIFYSTDGGYKWVYRNTGFHYAYALKKNSRGEYFAPTQNGIYRSLDRCNTWTKVNTAFDGHYFEVLNGTTLFCSTDYDGIIRSTDNGDTWQRVNTGLDVTFGPVIFPLPNGHMLAGTTGGAYVSTDQGDHWTMKNTGLGTVGLADFVIDSAGTYYASGRSGIWKSTDSGHTWSGKNTGLQLFDVSKLTLGKNGVVFACEAGGLYRSIDSGEHWTRLTVTTSYSGTPSGVIALPSGTVLALVSNLYRSTDNGETWTQTGAEWPIDWTYSFARHPDGSAIVWNNRAILVSKNDGVTWSQIPGSFYNPHGLSINGAGHLFVTDDYNGTRRSLDNGVTWEGVFPALNNTHQQLTAVNANGLLYVSDFEGSLYQSKDNGGTWTQPEPGFSQQNLSKLFVDAAGFLCAVTPQNGIFRSRVSTAPSPLPNVVPMLQLGRRRIKQPQMAVVPIWNIGGADASVSSCIATDTIFNFRQSAFSIPAYHAIEDTLDFTLPAIGLRSVPFIISYTGSSLADTVMLNVTGYGKPRIVFEPDTLDYGAVGLGDAKSLSVAIMNVGDDTLTISRWMFSSSVFSTSTAYPSVAPGRSLSVPIRFAPTALEAVNQRMIVTSNTVRGSDTLTLFGSGCPMPIISFSSRRIDFGRTQINRKKAAPLQIFNTGTDVLRFITVHPSDTAFTVSPDSVALEPHSSMWLTVEYTPSAAVKDSSIIILSSNTKQMTDTIIVTGIGDPTLSAPEEQTNLPAQFMLYQNFPNPFNPSTVIRFDLARAAYADLRIFNELGQQVASLAADALPPGHYERSWDARGLPSGMYFYRLRAGAFTETKKLLLMR